MLFDGLSKACCDHCVASRENTYTAPEFKATLLSLLAPTASVLPSALKATSDPNR